MRRSALENDPIQQSLARFGDFDLDIQNCELREGGMQVKLEPQIFKLLVFFVRHPWQLVGYEEISKELWRGERGDFRKRLSVAVLELRKKLRDLARKPRYIKTIHKKGYMFICPVAWHSSTGIVLVESIGSADVEKMHGSITTRHQAVLRALPVMGAVAAVAALLGWSMLKPVIVSVTPIRPRASQTIVIMGRRLGNHAPYTDEGSEYLAIRDKTAGWAAGRKIPENWDEVRLSVDSWTDSQIVIRAFSGSYDKNGWKLSPGDAIEIAVWNPQRTIFKGEAEAGKYKLQVIPGP